MSRSVGRRLAALATALLAWCWASAAAAHNLPYSLATLTVQADGAYRLELRCHTASLVLGLPQGHLTPEAKASLDAMPDAEVARREALMADYLQRATVVGVNAGRVAVPPPQFPTVPQVRLDGAMTLQSAAPSAPVVLAGRLPAGARTLTLTLPPELGNVLLKAEIAGAPVAAQALQAGEASAPLPIGPGVRVPALSTFGQYLTLGFQHILPKGLDHILFVVSLFLLIPRWKPLAAQITAFTLAHSVTLALAVFGLVALPSKVIETAIAVSIVAVAVDNLRTEKLAPWRPFVVFAFGLLHGMGFASVLRDLGLPRGQEALSLVAFNLGIELGQLTVLALAFIALGWTIRRAWYRRRVVLPASFAIALVAGLWAVQRMAA